jgi:hypothetical protein
MKKLNLCLEEYVDYIVENKAFEVDIKGEGSYRIYYVDSKAEIIVPCEPGKLSEEDPAWTISGDGANGFIITMRLE